MYGTVQAALQFFKKMVQNLTKVGLRQSKVDPCVFFIKKNNALILIIATHVDDCAIAGKPNDIKWFKNEIKKHFTIKELGPLKKHLGVWYDWGQDKVGRYWIILLLWMTVDESLFYYSSTCQWYSYFSTHYAYYRTN